VRLDRLDQIRRAAVVQEEEALSQPRPIDAAPPGWSLDGCGGARKRMSWTGGARARGARCRCRVRRSRGRAMPNGLVGSAVERVDEERRSTLEKLRSAPPARSERRPRVRD